MHKVMNGPHMGPFNVGNPKEFTMLELAKVVQEVVDPSATIVYRENTADDPTRRRPDISKVPHAPPCAQDCCFAAHTAAWLEIFSCSIRVCLLRWTVHQLGD